MNDLTIIDLQQTLTEVSPEYKSMLANIQERMPAVQHDASNFYKHHSQFMQTTLDVTALTPLRSIYHTLAEVDKTKAALQEVYFSLRKQDIELRRKQAALEAASDPFDRELLEVEILELQSQRETTMNHVNGAIRKMNFFVNQHKLLLEKIGKDEITEEDFEREECRYHILTALKQGLNAARARGGIIDEGNHIYFFELGISGAQVQAEVLAYLRMEEELLNSGRAPTHEATIEWMNACADKWMNDPEKFARYRGVSVFDPESLANPKQLETC